jgi:hypothetical protein
MKIENKDGSVTTQGVKEANSFTINDSSAQMVIDSLINLYSDPIGSVMRELVSNAVDANRERDMKIKGEIPLEEGVDDLKYFAKDKPQVEVSYINGNDLLGIDHSITIQDFGNGLSPERVKKVFTVFGVSTKRDTDSLIGGYGIGAKSTFAYTDTFYVRATHNGTARLYMLYKGNALPAMDLVSETSSDEKNNTIITIPLKSRYDLDDFESKIKSQLKFFTNVIYKGFKNVTTFSTKIAYESDNIIIPSENEPERLCALIGRVVYPLDFDLLEDIHGKQAPGYLRFKIGELDLVPSRENLRYTDKTIEAIKTKLATVKTESLKAIQDRIDNITDLAEHYILVNSIKSYSNRYWSATSVKDGAIDTLAYLGRYAPDKITLAGYNKYLYKAIGDYIKLKFEVKIPSTNNRRNRSNNFIMGESYIQTILNSLYMENREVYYVENNYSGGKNAKLHDENGNDFLLFKIGGYSLSDKVGAGQYTSKTSISEEDLEECSEQLEKYIMNHPNLKKYEDVDASDYTESASGVVREKGTYPFREMYKKYGNGTVYKQTEADIQDLKDEEKIVIYGSNEDESKLQMAFRILYKINNRESSKTYYEHDRIDGYRILKVNQQLSKKLKNHIHVEDFFIKKYPEVKKFYTSYKLESFNFPTVRDIMKNVETAMPDNFRQIYNEVDSYYKKYRNYSAGMHFDEDLKTQFLSFIEDHTDLKKDIEIKRLAELIKYLNQAPLLKYVEKPYDTSRMEKFTEEVKNYVSLLNISLDTSLLPIPEIEEDTEEKEEQKVIN